MFCIFNTTSYKKGAALAVGATAFWKMASFASSILIALYFGATADTDLYFYLIMLVGFGITFMQKLNGSVLIPEAMFLAEQDENQSRRFLTLGFYFYVLLGLALGVLGLLVPVQLVGLFSRFDSTLLAQEQILLCAAFFWFATNLVYYYLIAVAEMHKFFATALLGPLNALCPLLSLILLGKSVGIISMLYGFLAANVLQIGLLMWLLHKKLHWDFTPRPCTIHPRAKKNMLSGQTLAIIDIVNNLLPVYLISGMSSGLVSALSYCKQLTDSPTEIITIRVANVSKIEMTENAAKGQVNVFNKNFLSTHHLLLFLLTPLAVFSAYFALDIIALFFLRGEFSLQDAADTARFMRPMLFTLVLLVPAYLQNNTISAWCKIKESFPYALVSSLTLAAGVWFLVPKFGAFIYPYVLLGGLCFGFVLNYFLFKIHFPFVNYFRSFWELFRLLAINIIALLPAAMIRIFLPANSHFLSLLCCGSVYVAVMLLISYKSRDLQLFLNTTEISATFKKLF
ncbi:MAG: hypothetical protein IKJ44_00760 [Elusimicrobiaceae bacterium]|nr:hypothetical protein [Elusimicrobiaceae bacterium]